MFNPRHAGGVSRSSEEGMIVSSTGAEVSGEESITEGFTSPEGSVSCELSVPLAEVIPTGLVIVKGLTKFKFAHAVNELSGLKGELKDSRADEGSVRAEPSRGSS